MSPAAPIITLLTDFGDEDGFVGAMRGVMLSRAPRARLVDLAHHVPRGDVAKAARVLARSAPHFPPGTIHCVVVDPGVGSSRHAVAVAAAGHRFIAPDNGVLTDVLTALGAPVSALPPTAARLITHPDARRAVVSHTFHGRDLFAPAAAALAAGLALDAIGPVAPAPLVRLDRRPPRTRLDGSRIGHIVEVDRFGNLITDLDPPDGRFRLSVARSDDREALALMGPAPSYSAVSPGEFVVVCSSQGTLEIAVRDGSAAERLDLAAGDRVTIAPFGRPTDVPDQGEPR